MVEYGEKQWDKKRPEVDLLVEAEMGLSLGLHLVYGKIPNFCCIWYMKKYPIFLGK